MNRHRSRGPSLNILLLLSLLPATVFGQYGTGVILGAIKDASGAVIPNATVTVRNDATNEKRELKTDADGFYRFNALPSGTYTISATAPSFRTSTVEKTVLQVNSEVRADIVMQVGNVNEKVEVMASTPQLQTNTAAMGGVIDNRTMLELPLNNRNFFDLAA